MRLRNIKGADEAINNSIYCILYPSQQKGCWHEFLGNDRPIHIEVGMGKGRFLMELAAQNPDINYIGIERYTSVLLRAVQKMDEAPLPNVHFLCIDAANLNEIFDEGEVDRIYLNFSDPWPKDRHAKRRLTSRQFLARYDEVLDRGSKIIFKTDNRPLFDFSLEEAEEAGWTILLHTFDLHHSEYVAGNIMTEYEEKFVAKGNPICKMVICHESLGL